MSFTHNRKDETLPALKAVLHRCTLARGRMMHVVNNLSAFLMFEVIIFVFMYMYMNIDIYIFLHIHMYIYVCK
jgi:hypothetical protein